MPFDDRIQRAPEEGFQQLTPRDDRPTDVVCRGAGGEVFDEPKPLLIDGQRLEVARPGHDGVHGRRRPHST